jgi:NTP pyrophosphatase (non-canonical NTP hydrolase)
MERTEYIALLQEALDKWGFDTQVLIWIEEMSELIQVLAKRDRHINPSYDSQIEEELADVDICLDQMIMILIAAPELFERHLPIISKVPDTKRYINKLSNMISTLSDTYFGELQLLFNLAELCSCLKELKQKYPGYEGYRVKKIERLKRLVQLS